MPGLLRGMARTAVISATATHVSNNVSRRQAQRWAQEDSASIQEPSSAAASTDPYAELERLAQLKDQGIITADEFDAKKKQLLGL